MGWDGMINSSVYVDNCGLMNGWIEIDGKLMEN